MARQAANDIGDEAFEADSEPVQGSAAHARQPGGLPIGERLRLCRESLGIELRDVSDTLRIRYDYLLAIEERRYKDLPAPVYAIGFIRSYAAFLDLDPEEAVRDFKADYSPGQRSSGIRPAKQQSPRKRKPNPAETPEDEGQATGERPSRAIWIAVAAVILVAVGGWELYLASRQNAVAPEQQAAAPQQSEAVSEAVSSEPEAPAAGPVSEPISGGPVTDMTPVGDLALTPGGAGQSAEVGIEQSPMDAAMDAQPDTGGLQPLADDRLEDVTAVPTEAVEQAAAEAPEASTGATGEDLAGLSGTVDPLPQSAADPSTTVLPDADAAAPAQSAVRPDGAAQVVLRATADSWVQVRDASDSLIMTRVLRAGDIYQVPTRRGLILVTGNAGGLQISVDGEPIPPLGPSGSVRRNVSLDPESLLARAAQQ